MYRTTLLILLCALLPQPSCAQGNEDEISAMLFLEAISMPKRAAVCAARLDTFSVRFDPAFAKWKLANTAALAKGEAFLRKEAVSAKMDFNVHVALVTDLAAKMLISASQSMLEKNCDGLLRALNAPETQDRKLNNLGEL